MTVAPTLLKTETEEAVGLICVAITSGGASEGQDNALPFAYSFLSLIKLSTADN